MDVVTTLNFFDRWFEGHKVTCRVSRVNVSTERDVERTRVKLACPMCRNTISGTISTHDWPPVEALLSKERQS